MIPTEALQTVQFVTVKGKRFAVLSADDWEALVEWVEDLEDAQMVRAAFAELRIERSFCTAACRLSRFDIE